MDMEKDNREETLEELFGRLDRIIAKLEDRDTTLEDSFRCV